MLDVETGAVLLKANPGNNVFLECEPPLVDPEVLAILRRKMTKE